MKLGCGTWAFSSPHYQPPYDEAIKIIGDMGFQALEMILFEEGDLRTYYTPQKIAALRSAYEAYGMTLSEFAIYTPIVADLANMDEARREAGFRKFVEGANVAKALGSEAVNLVSNWAQDIKCPIEYPPCYITPFVNGVGRASPKWKMEIPDIDYTQLWENYMAMVRRCLDYCVSSGMKFYIEGHANVIVSGTDAMLRMFDRIPDENLGINFDTAWHMIQREYLPLSIKKLGKRIRHFHMRDGDGMFCYALPTGMGVIDWEGVFRALGEVGFDGTLSFEIGGFADRDDTIKYIRDAKEYVEKQLKLAGIALA